MRIRGGGRAFRCFMIWGVWIKAPGRFASAYVALEVGFGASDVLDRKVISSI